MMSNRGEVRLNMAELSDYIREQIATLQLQFAARGSESSPRLKMQKVSSILRDIKPDFQKYFEPRVTAIGPFHHGNAKFERSEQLKHLLAARFSQENGRTPDDLFNKIKAEIKDLRRYYDPKDIRDYSDDKLAWMFFVDGCAVLYAVHYGEKHDFDKLAFKADRLVHAQRDLFLLENQLPYRVLQILIQSAEEPKKWENSVTDFIRDNLITNIQLERSQHTDEEEKEKHYTHLLERFRKKLLSGREEKNSSSIIGSMFLGCGDNRKNRKTFRSIKELKESGINVRPGNSNNLKSISFHCNFLGSIRMPRFLVDDSTATKFMNLVALEMCLDFENDFEVTSYLCFLDSLINTAEDVKELRVTGVLHNYLGSDQEVADLFNKMSRDLVPDQGSYGDVMKNIRNYCNNPLTSAMAQAYYTHFSSPWTFLAFLAAMMALFFSAIQAYSSLFPHGNKSHCCD